MKKGKNENKEITIPAGEKTYEKKNTKTTEINMKNSEKKTIKIPIEKAEPEPQPQPAPDQGGHSGRVCTYCSPLGTGSENHEAKWCFINPASP